MFNSRHTLFLLWDDFNKMLRVRVLNSYPIK